MGGMTDCIVCHGATGDARLIPQAMVRPSVGRAIEADHPGWDRSARICRTDLDRYVRQHIARLLADEDGAIGSLEEEVLDAVMNGTPVSAPPPDASGLGSRMADRVAAFGGSWTFILGFLAVLLTWMALNVTGVIFGPFDPYPFVFLNLILSCVAALQAPVIMMSQRRQDEKDRLPAENDYRVNLKAELEIRQLHEKLDHYALSVEAARRQLPADGA